MTKADKCKECEHSNDFKGCALQHITTARKLLAEGDIAGTEHQLSCLERHLKQI